LEGMKKEKKRSGEGGGGCDPTKVNCQALQGNAGGFKAYHNDKESLRGGLIGKGMENVPLSKSSLLDSREKKAVQRERRGFSFHDGERHFAGARTRGTGQDFILEKDKARLVQKKPVRNSLGAAASDLSAVEKVG